MLLPVPRTADYKRIDVYIAARRPVHPCDRGNSCARRVALQARSRSRRYWSRNSCHKHCTDHKHLRMKKCLLPKPQTNLRRTSRVSDSNSIALLERTSLTVRDPGVRGSSRGGLRPILLTLEFGRWLSPPGKVSTRSKPRS